MNRELPILFSAPMVKALLEGRKSMTRRIVNIKKLCGPSESHASRGRWICENGLWRSSAGKFNVWSEPAPCPYGRAGDRLWVKENFNLYDGEGTVWSGARLGTLEAMPEDYHAVYDADRPDGTEGLYRWRPSIHMPRWASRITLEITSVRVERLQEISEEDCYAEGIARPHPDGAFPHTNAVVANVEFRALWESINGPKSWEESPWVWAISFQRVAS